MVDGFLKTNFSDIIDILDYHKKIFGTKGEISINSHLNIKDDIFLLVSFFSSFDDKFEDSLIKTMLDDILNLLKYFDSINYNDKDEKSFCGNQLSDIYEEHKKNNDDLPFEEFKIKYFESLRDLRAQAIPIINTKLYYFDLLIWDKARKSKLILRILRVFGANDSFNTKEFLNNKDVSFKSMISYKYVAQNSKLNPIYDKIDIIFIKNLAKQTEVVDEVYEENFNRLIAVKNKIEIFKGMADGDIRLVVKDVSFMKFNPHETIIREGELSEEIFFIASGSCRVTANHKAVGLLSKNQIFGEFSAITKDLRTATIRTNSVVTILSFKLATELFNEIPESFSNLYKNVIDELIKKIDLSNKKKY